MSSFIDFDAKKSDVVRGDVKKLRLSCCLSIQFGEKSSPEFRRQNDNYLVEFSTQRLISRCS